MRTCTDCGTAFEATGKNYRCNPCRRVWDKAWRARRKADGCPVRSGRMPREYQRSYEAEYRNRDGVRERLADRARIRSKSPQERHKHEARWKVNRAIAAGRLTREPCSVCGSERSQAHHPDYSKPLEVVWLCAKHHADEHARAEGGAA